LFKGKARDVGQRNHMCASALAGSSLWIMQNDVVIMNVGIGESQQLSYALTASCQVKT
jgi:hypothetical protein